MSASSNFVLNRFLSLLLITAFLISRQTALTEAMGDAEASVKQ
jgi:hypothetical protein